MIPSALFRRGEREDNSGILPNQPRSQPPRLPQSRVAAPHGVTRHLKTQNSEGDVVKAHTGGARRASDDAVSEPDLIAIGLLSLQQRFDALDRLYNEEIGALCQELARLKADYVRRFYSGATQPPADPSAERVKARRAHRRANGALPKV